MYPVRRERGQEETEADEEAGRAQGAHSKKPHRNTIPMHFLSPLRALLIDGRERCIRYVWVYLGIFSNFEIFKLASFSGV